MNKEKKNSLERLLRKVANEWGFKIYSLNLHTNRKPIVIEIIIKKTNCDGMVCSAQEAIIVRKKYKNFKVYNKKYSLVYSNYLYDIYYLI